MQYPNTAMVTASDLGSGTHPVNKSGYGTRAARVALGMVYGQKLEIYGPIYQSSRSRGQQGPREVHARRPGTWRPATATSCKVSPSPARTRSSTWADAVIDGDTVVVSSDKVAKPVAVRYAWASDHPWANLFNKDGLPALTFRTDSW